MYEPTAPLPQKKKNSFGAQGTTFAQGVFKIKELHFQN